MRPSLPISARKERYRAQLVVAADGRDSPSREKMGIGLIGWSYPQWGIVATVAHEKPHEGVAYEHFLPSGPFAILPMTENRSSLVWTEREDDRAADAGAVRRRVQRGGGAALRQSSGRHASRRSALVLSAEIPSGARLCAPRFALAGDTAHGIHPIAGQGLNLGLKDAAALAEVVLDAARLGLDIGALDVLKRYERWRRFDSVTLCGLTMDALNRLFSNDIAPLRAIRDLGIGIVDRVGPLRRFLHASGRRRCGKVAASLAGRGRLAVSDTIVPQSARFLLPLNCLGDIC